MSHISPKRSWSPALAKLHQKRNRSVDTKKLLDLTADLGLDGDIAHDEDLFRKPGNGKPKLPPSVLGDAAKTGSNSKTRSRSKEKKHPKQQKMRNSWAPGETKSPKEKTKLRRGRKNGGAAGRSKSPVPKSKDGKSLPRSMKDTKSLSPTSMRSGGGASGSGGGGRRKSFQLDANSLDALSLSIGGVDIEEEVPPPEVAAKIAICQDLSQPLRKRVELENEMRRHPEEWKFFVQAKQKKKRRDELEAMDKSFSEMRAEVEQSIMEGNEMARKEEEEIAARKAQRQKEAQDKRERERATRDFIKKNAAETMATGFTELRKKAEETKTVQARNIEQRKKEEEEHQAYKEEMLSYQDNDVMRKLVEARIDQQQLKTHRHYGMDD